MAGACGKRARLEEKEAEGDGDRDGGVVPVLPPPPCRQIRGQGLSCEYRLLFGPAEADGILRRLEQDVRYLPGESPGAFPEPGGNGGGERQGGGWQLLHAGPGISGWWHPRVVAAPWRRGSELAPTPLPLV